MAADVLLRRYRAAGQLRVACGRTLTGAPAGLLVYCFEFRGIPARGFIDMQVRYIALRATPIMLGGAGYVMPIVAITTSYALFLTANNIVVTSNVAPDQRGAIRRLLNLSQNL